MWFTREQFRLCDELRQWGLEPRFEPGDVVARGFADLGYEEFQVLPGPKLLSLTAGTVTLLPGDHRTHFFWIPSVDEAISLIEKAGAAIRSCSRPEGREWVLELAIRDTIEELHASGFHDVVLKAVAVVYRTARSTNLG